MKDVEFPIPIEKNRIDALAYYALCMISYKNEQDDYRHIRKKEFVKTKWLEKIVSIQDKDKIKMNGGKVYTMDKLRTALKGLEKNGYVKYDEEKECYKIYKGKSYTSVSTNLYEYFVNTGNKDVLMVYAIVKNYHVGGTFYINGVLTQMGLTHGGTNYNKVRNILTRLNNDGLIEIEEHIKYNQYKSEVSMFKIKAINKEVRDSIKKIKHI